MISICYKRKNFYTSMLNSFQEFWIKSFSFRGKCGRDNFWLTLLTNGIILVILILISIVWIALFGDSPALWTEIARGSVWRFCNWSGLGYCGSLPFELVTLYLTIGIVPNISIQLRRLRDAGFSLWFLLVGLIPCIGAIILFIMYLQPSRNVMPD